MAHAGLGFGRADTILGTNQSMGFSFEAAWLFRLGGSGLRLGPRAELASYSTFHNDGKVTYGTRNFGGGVQAEYDFGRAPLESLDTDYELGAYAFILGGAVDLTTYDNRLANEITTTRTGGGLTVGTGLNCYIGDELYLVVGASAAYSRGFGSAESDSVRVLGQLGVAFE